MHILMYRWKAYNYRDIEQTFLLLGHTVDNIEQELGSYDVSPEFERVIEEKIGADGCAARGAGKTGKTECHTGFGDAEIPRRCGVCGKPL